MGWGFFKKDFSGAFVRRGTGCHDGVGLGAGEGSQKQPLDVPENMTKTSRKRSFCVAFQQSTRFCLPKRGSFQLNAVR